VIPTIISQLASGRSDVRLGLLTPTRDFTFVRDTADAFVAVGTAPAAQVVGRVLNAGTGREISIGDLATTIGAIMERPVQAVEEADRMRPEGSEVMRLLCDASALRDATGWAPRHSLEEGLRETVAWFSQPENLARYRWWDYNI